METFSADWLALREPADAQARSAALETSLTATLARVRVDAVRVVDLGCGAGSNARHLIPRIHGSQEWRLVDHDRHLLDVAIDRTRQWADAHGYRRVEGADALDLRRGDDRVTLRTMASDLAALDDTLFRHEGSLLVTAAALLDLTSPEWIESLADRCRAAHATAFFALSYDGRIECTPPDAFDEVVRDLVNAHQRTDKGFGPAAGPDAAVVCARAFDAAGFHVTLAPSEWRLGPSHAVLQQQLVDGWARAAAEMVLDRADHIHDWRDRRTGHIAAGTSHITVGHQDLLAAPRRA